MGHSHRLGMRREGLGPEEYQTRHAATHDHEQCVCVCVCVCVCTHTRMHACVCAWSCVVTCLNCLVLLRPHPLPPRAQSVGPESVAHRAPEPAYCMAGSTRWAFISMHDSTDALYVYTYVPQLPGHTMSRCGTGRGGKSQVRAQLEDQSNSHSTTCTFSPTDCLQCQV